MSRIVFIDIVDIVDIVVWWHGGIVRTLCVKYPVFDNFYNKVLKYLIRCNLLLIK